MRCPSLGRSASEILAVTYAVQGLRAIGTGSKTSGHSVPSPSIKLERYTAPAVEFSLSALIMMAAMGANVIEIESPNLRGIRHSLLGTEGIVAAAQLGARLRVLVRDNIQDPADFLKKKPETGGATLIEQIRPNLEDVFVTATGEGRQ